MQYQSNAMNNQPLVSVIIPTYNRAHLIGETLDSVLAQTYLNWECIIVDDGSSDNTDEVVSDYVSKDSRFKYFHRPDEHLPGGNGARNYGFKMSQGEYVNWFDSDDLMVAEKLEVKVKAMLENDVDFVVSQTKYFNAPGNINDYKYDFKEDEVSFESFTSTYISWYTPDFFVSRNLVSNINFNEQLKSGQEFNYISKVLLKTNKLKIIRKHLTLRRYAEDSIGVKRRQNKDEYLRTTFENSWITFKEIYPLSGYNKAFGQKLLLKCIRSYLEQSNIEKPKLFFNEIIKFYGLQSRNFFFAVLSSRLTGKYQFFYNKLKVEN
ncbi:glycosyltransferase family 2 protein [Psychroflexus montanilacus]|uniref:glycosyltransferase family 2 protein n=1 Tax=Psychroflexus montanilacus TaxID=2873598 RepID=UPI001CCDA61C|nr:glycosyltransferase family 2 protein [Psychroflexus montanilacus]MBZ9652109.1 glycosyltransferase family 2 protein [Psychroflexus montanilacus]